VALHEAVRVLHAKIPMEKITQGRRRVVLRKRADKQQFLGGESKEVYDQGHGTTASARPVVEPERKNFEEKDWPGGTIIGHQSWAEE